MACPEQHNADELTEVVESLCMIHTGHPLPKQGTAGHRVMPTRQAVIDIIEDLRKALFPGYFGDSELSPVSVRFHVGATPYAAAAK